MILFPHVKINLGLHITGLRPDGYHDLETIFYPVLGCGDVLEVNHAEQTELILTGIPIPGEPEKNLVMRAYRLLEERYQVGPARMHLHKIIPTATGLGAGSSDATFTLRGLNQLFNLHLSVGMLADLAGELGSDTPFFAYDEPLLGQGRGEVLSTVNVDLKGWYVMIVFLGIHISTAQAFKGVMPEAAPIPLTEIMKEPVYNWQHLLHNQFEDTVFEAEPGIAQVKELLYSQGAIYAAMSGSGSALYGLFEANPGQTDMGWGKWERLKCWVGQL